MCIGVPNVHSLGQQILMWSQNFQRDTMGSHRHVPHTWCGNNTGMPGLFYHDSRLGKRLINKKVRASNLHTHTLNTLKLSGRPMSRRVEPIEHRHARQDKESKGKRGENFSDVRFIRASSRHAMATSSTRVSSCLFIARQKPMRLPSFGPHPKLELRGAYVNSSIEKAGNHSEAFYAIILFSSFLF